MYGLDYEPRNAKEKWLHRIVLLGNDTFVAFFFWEYVKAKQGGTTDEIRQLHVLTAGQRVLWRYFNSNLVVTYISELPEVPLSSSMGTFFPQSSGNALRSGEVPPWERRNHKGKEIPDGYR
jgi:hypothetical protein